MDDLDLTEKTPRAFEDDPSQPPPLPRTRAARGSAILSPPPIPQRARRAATLPPPLPTGARRISAVQQVPIVTQTPMLSTTIAPSKLIPFLPQVEPIPMATPLPALPKPELLFEDDKHIARSPITPASMDAVDVDMGSDTDDDPSQVLSDRSMAVEYTSPVGGRRNTGAYIAGALAAAFAIGGVFIYLMGRGAN